MIRSLVRHRAGRKSPVVVMMLLLPGALIASTPVSNAPPPADPDWHIPLRATQAVNEPAHPEYRQLRAAFGRYRAVVERGGWTFVPAGPELRIGQRDPRVPAIRARLRESGDFNAFVEADVLFFDTGMDQAVRRFQRRHRLRADGIVGERTRAAMNVPVQERLVQIAVALERWRWLPDRFGTDYIWINVPESELRFMRGGEVALSMPVVVGHPHRPTPTFVSRVRQLVFNPPWYVPNTIAAEDLLPRLRGDAGLIERIGLRVYRNWDDKASRVPAGQIDWASVDAHEFPFQLVQQPGPANSLGRVKLVMDNPFDIYLHDSPAWRLFYLSARTLSSGCVRLRDAPALVHELMRRDQGWTEAQTLDRLRLGPTDFVDLRDPVPIFIVYMTSWVGPDGLVFARDVYRRDERLAASLSGAGLAALIKHVEGDAPGDQLALRNEAPRL